MNLGDPQISTWPKKKARHVRAQTEILQLVPAKNPGFTGVFTYMFVKT